MRAWVESPLQLLSVIEAHAAGLLGAHTTIVPRADVSALRPTVDCVRVLGLPSGLEIQAPSRDRSAGASAAATWVVGDVFSGRVQRSLLARRPGRMVIVDDGRATLHLLSVLTGPERAPLLRARVMPAGSAAAVAAGLPRRVLGAVAAARLREAAAAGRLTVVTTCELDAATEARAREAGVQLAPNDFGWLRGRPPAQAPDQRTVVLGSAMVVDGLLRQRPYLGWVADRADGEPLAYFPHRREDATTLAALRSRAGIRVYDSPVPVELALSGLTSQHRVVSLPSSAALTLRTLLAGRGTEVHVDEVPHDWWTERTSAAQRAHLGDTASLVARAGVAA